MAEQLSSFLRREALANLNFRERRTDLAKTFREHRQRFEGVTKTYKPLEEGASQLPDETKTVGTTVREELDWFRPFFVNAVSTSFVKEATNQRARATLHVFGLDFKEVPATALLNLEGKLKELKATIKHLPTLEDSKTWTPDNRQRGTKRIDPDDWTYRTEKKPYNHVKSPATDKHPAQVEVLQHDQHVGKWTKRHFSGAISTEAKAIMMSRVDEAIREVVSAREEANKVEILAPGTDIGAKIFDAIFTEELIT